MSTEEEDQARREKLAIEPTIPATDMRPGMPDLSHERRPTDVDSGGGAPVWVIVGLVAAVGVAFWWFTGSRAKTPAASPSPVVEPAKPVTPATAPAAAPKAAPRPAPKAAGKPEPGTAATAAPPAPATAPTTAPATAESPAPAARKVAHAHKHHKKPKSSKAKEVKLPRLPSPPPADP